MRTTNQNNQSNTSHTAREQQSGQVTTFNSEPTAGKGMIVRRAVSAGAALCLAISLLLPAARVHAQSSYVAGSNSAACNSADIEAVAPVGSDLTKPALTVLTLDDDAITNTPILTVSGNVADDGTLPSVTVNGHSVQLDENGHFNMAVALTEGENIITVVATDAAGNDTTNARAITYIVKKPELAADATSSSGRRS
jgi:hypothetical protein